MLRVIVTLLIGAIVGLLLGSAQFAMSFGGYEERFEMSRASLAETRGEMTKQEVLNFQTGTPRVQVDGGTKYNFGTMQHGESQSHEFVFRNIGDGPLNLDMGQSSCKCTVGDLESSVLMPGEETVVKLTWKAQTVLADFGQNATIITNDPEQTEVKLQIEGQVAHSFLIQPATISLGEFSNMDGTQRKFHVISYLEGAELLEDFEWVNAKTSKFVEITWEPTELEPEKFPRHQSAFSVNEVTLRIKPGMPIGPFATQINFETDQGEDVGRLEVPVTGRVAGDLTLVGGASLDVERNRVRLGNVKSSEGAGVTIYLRVRGKNASEIAPSVVSVHPEESLNVTIGKPSKRVDGQMFPIRLEVPKGAPPARFPGTSASKFGKVVIKTNHEINQEIPIYVQVVVTK